MNLASLWIIFFSLGLRLGGSEFFYLLPRGALRFVQLPGTHLLFLKETRTVTFGNSVGSVLLPRAGFLRGFFFFPFFIRAGDNLCLGGDLFGQT